MNCKLNTAYSYHWKKIKDSPDRLNFQLRAVETFQKLFQELLNIPFKGNILDLGCGDGSLVRAMNTIKDISAHGTDISEGINFETDELPFDDNQFDIAIMYSVIEHIYDPGNILSQCKRVLKKNGKLLIVTPNFKTTKESFYDDPTHIRPFTPTGIEVLMNIYDMKKDFMGLWTVGKSVRFWKFPVNIQFMIGKCLPFNGNKRFVPGLLMGKSTTMLCVFENKK
ncbi:MAG: class I SAM-dependent methyltransferase [Pseudomonadota bacterium]